MTPHSFTEKDKDNLIEFLNFISDKASFTLNTKETIKFYGLLAWAQKELVPKIDANILEVKAVKEMPAESEAEPEKPKKGKGKK